MYPILAELAADGAERDGRYRAAERRQKSRRKLRLGVPTYLDPQTVRAVIHDLSEVGLMLETNANLSVGDSFEVELPEAGLVGVEVAWCIEGRFGCRFERPVSKAAISASLLRSPADRWAVGGGYQSWAGPEATVPSSGEPRRATSLLATEFSLLLLIFVVSLFIFALASLPISAG